MPGELVRAKECRLAICRDSRRRRDQTRDEVVLPATIAAASRRVRLSDVPQVEKPVSARRYFPQNLLGREASKELVRAINLGVPCFEPESDVRAFVSHGCVSCQPLRF